MKIIFVVVVTFCGFAAGNHKWTKISTYPVCFQGLGDRYGFLHYMGSSPKLVAGIMLVYDNGEIRCVTDTQYNSKWGCYRYASFKGYRLNVVVTDSNNNVIFPKPEYIMHPAGLWYWLPGIDELHSNELVFTDFATPFYVKPGTQLRIWYGEDLKNWSESDNQGQICVHVYALFM